MSTRTFTDEPRRHRLTVADYHRMGEAGVLDARERVELVEGQLIDMPPIGSLHAGTVTQVAELLQTAAAGLAMVRVQNPITLGRYSEPQPDVALLRLRQDFYKSAHPRPEDVLLLIEVADTSLHYDRTVKLPLYARHGVPEVWLIDLAGRQLRRYRGPRESGYDTTDQPALTAPVEIGGVANARVELGGLFAP